MLFKKKISKSLNKIKRNTLRNKIALSKVKTHKNKCFFFIKKQLTDKTLNYLPLIFTNFNLAYRALDKSQKVNLLPKRTVSRKKMQLQSRVTFLLKFLKC